MVFLLDKKIIPVRRFSSEEVGGFPARSSLETFSFDLPTNT